MTHFKRSKIHVDRNENWKNYTRRLPKDAEAVGVVTVGGSRSKDGSIVGGEKGTLVRFKNTGLYAMANAGSVRNLDGRKVVSALGMNIGRPNELEKGKRVNVYLDAESVNKAKALGDGNVSEGIRKALRLVNE